MMNKKLNYESINDLERDIKHDLFEIERMIGKIFNVNASKNENDARSACFPYHR